MSATVAGPPRLRPDVVLGPGLRSGTRTVHHVKDAGTGCFYRVGPREHFIMGLMDGRRSLEDIERRYAERYRRRLGPDSWRQMFTLLGRYQLLDGHADPAVLERLRQANEAKHAADTSWLRHRWVLLRPDRLCAALARRLRFAFRPAFVVPVLLLLAVFQGYVWSRAGVLLHDAVGQEHRLYALPLSLVLAWLLTMVHELAHGVACRHFGGHVAEIGLRWRFPMLTPYCRTDDIVLFPRRSARVGTAFAGIFAGLLVLVPVAVWWRLSPDGQAGHAVAAGLLLFGSGSALTSLLPFLQMDGYVMLAHSLDLADLRRDSFRYVRLLPRRRDPAARAALSAYPARDAWAYAVYGIVTPVAGLGAYGALMTVWYATLRHWMPGPWAVALLVVETAVFAGLVALAARGRAGGGRGNTAGQAADA